MEHNELYGLLELPEEVIARLNAYEKSRKGAFRISFQELTENRELVQTLDKVIAKEIGEDEDGIGILWEELQIALQTFEEYRRKGIPTDIFAETMKFCTRFLRDDYKKYHDYRFVWGWWFPRQLAMREFRIGALEYEYDEEGCIKVHIPSDADLSKESVQSSFSQFELFCRTYYPAWEGLEMRCHSWLLSPALKNVLDEHSHILAFQELFEEEETDYESMAVMNWVFPGYDTVSENLPEETSLQINMKKYLLEGKKIGWTKGRKK